ncbi:hypothetical protein cand_012060 [Cryptosporidium andersoni]|uniref:Transmembrane protein n=1 Tax=Cryptosporidium andersoni TaxID=117008 RepID=A0A1J4MGD6_9CRYT|nr:hypothetical protein cand_012060 [Cryptosporidium andersoni]
MDDILEEDINKLENKNVNIWKMKEAKLPLVALILSFIFPPIGCIAFLILSRAPKSSPRYKVAVAALYTGSLLSALYTFLIAMFLLALVGPKYKPYVILGPAY